MGIKEDLAAEETVAKLGELQLRAPTLCGCVLVLVSSCTGPNTTLLSLSLSSLTCLFSVSGVVGIDWGPQILSILQSQPSLSSLVLIWTEDWLKKKDRFQRRPGRRRNLGSR